MESCDGFCTARWEFDSTCSSLRGYVEPLARASAVSCLRCLVRKSLYPCGEGLRSWRPGMFVLFLDGNYMYLVVSLLTRGYSSRHSSIMDPFRIVAFYVSMALLCPVILTTAMIWFSQRTLVRHSSSKSISSGYRPDSIRPVPSPSPSPIRYRKASFDTFVFSDWTNQISP